MRRKFLKAYMKVIMDLKNLSSSGNAKADTILSDCSTEIFPLNEESDCTLLSIKAERDEDKFDNNNIENVSEEIEAICIPQKIEQEPKCQLVESSTKYQQCPLFVNVEMNNVKKEFQFRDDMNEKFTEEMLEEQHYSQLQHSKYTIDVLEPEVQCSIDVSHVNSYRNNIEVSSSSSNNKRKRATKRRKIAVVSDVMESNPSHVRDNEDPSNLQVLFNSPHQKNIYECHECLKILSSFDTLRRHVNRVHKRIKDYRCYECCKTFYDLAELRVHIDAVHKGRYECKECLKTFSSGGVLKKHVESVHKGIKKYQCYECHKMCSRKHHLKQHIDSLHGKIKNYVCNMCHTTFYLRSGLKKHIENVHKGIRNFECDICYKKFSRANGLNTHIYGVHKRIKHYECYICNKLFSLKGNLCKHVMDVHKNI